ncbi:MAG TPA: hypothetical protein VF519_10575 [Mycobacteriales bacterium]|jgi:hypothetical protein
MLARLATVATVTAAAVVAAPATSNAFIVENCSTKNGTCVTTAPYTVAPGTPALGPVGAEHAVVAGPRLCDTGGGGCVETYLLLPGAWVSTTQGTLVSVTVPSFGVDLRSTPTVYYGVPAVDASGTLDGTARVSVAVPLVPVLTSADGAALCPNNVASPLEAVRVSDCYVLVDVEVL